MKKVCLFLVLCILLTGGTALGESNGQSNAGPVAMSEEMLASLLDGSRSITVFYQEPFYENVTDEDSALAALDSIRDQLGADQTTDLVPGEVCTNEEGITYYTFRQFAGDISVFGSAVKLIVDPDGTAVGAVSSLLPNVPDAREEEWAISEKEAEDLIAEAFREDGAKVLTGLTHQTLLPDPDTVLSYYAWVVYTNNPWRIMDTAYVAHFLNGAGKYITSIAVQEPMSSETSTGEGTEFVFLGLEESSWTGNVTLSDGTVTELTVPTMTDPETGKEYLMDHQRKIVCADYLAFDTEETVKVRESTGGRWTDGEVITYSSFLQVWDFFNDIGWTGPDGEGTATLLLMDWVDEDGEPVRNACYSGMEHGFQTFCFNRLERDGECLDIIGHEFYHCVSDTLMTANLYQNDYGAINEGLSDIVGNLLEAMLTENPSPDWLVGEGAKGMDMVIRCMSDPHRFSQPEYVWDLYYVPAVKVDSDENDNGGVHMNSSLLNLIGYRLFESGMEPEDELYYWMNVTMALTPRTDYPQLAELLPWCMTQMGYDAYLDVLTSAIEETQIAETFPSAVPEGCAFIYADLPGELSVETDQILLTFIDPESEDDVVSFWPDARYNFLIGAVPIGEYELVLEILDEEGEPDMLLICTDQGWLTEEEAEELLDEGFDLDFIFQLDAGEYYEIDL